MTSMAHMNGPFSITSLSRRRFLLGSLAVAGTAMFVACSPAGAPALQSANAAQSPATIATSQPATTASASDKLVDLKVGVVGAGGLTPIEAGVSLGIFQKDGLNVEILGHRGGAEAAQALVGGGVQVFQGDFTHAIRLNQQGQQIRVFAGVTDRHGYTLVGSQNAKPGVQGLKGQKIGITSPGSQSDTALRWLAKNNGWDPDKDFELVAIGNGSPMLAAIQKGQVYAGMANEPFTSLLKSQNAPVVYDFPEETYPFQGLTFMAKQSWLKENPDTARRFLKSYLSVVKLLSQDEKTRNELARKAYPDLDPKIAEEAAARLIKTYSLDGKVTEAGVKKVFEFEQAVATGSKPVPALADFSDFSYLP